MPAPKAVWAVIGVAVSLYRCAAVIAGKVFYTALEAFVGGHVQIMSALEFKGKPAVRAPEQESAFAKATARQVAASPRSP